MSDIDWESINEAVDFSDCVNNTTVQAKIVSVYDGDTVKAILDLEGKNYKFYPSMMYSVNSTKNLITHIFNIFFTNYERHSVLIRK